MSVRTTITLEDDVVERLRESSLSNGTSFKETVNEAIRVGLDKLARRAEPPAIKPFRMGAPKLDIDNIDELLTYLEGEDYR